MAITRRHILALAGSSVLSRVLGATATGIRGQGGGELGRVLNLNSAEMNPASRQEVRKYSATATITFLSIPLVSKSSVGSGYAVVEEAGNIIAIQFGAGSYPESARGLNRLGFIQEGVIEQRPGWPAECAWLAFMTTSKENNLDQAKKALQEPAGMVPYSASQGYGSRGSFASRVEQIEFPSRFTWRDINPLVQKAREAMAANAGDGEPAEGAAEEQTGTFLYMVRKAMLDERARTTSSLVFNKKQFRMETRKTPDEGSTAYFAAKNVVPRNGTVIRMDATLTNRASGEKTPFRLWYEAGATPALPLRFEYQAKSFLRLTFEADAKAVTPPIQFAFKTSKEVA